MPEPGPEWNTSCCVTWAQSSDDIGPSWSLPPLRGRLDSLGHQLIAATAHRMRWQKQKDRRQANLPNGSSPESGENGVSDSASPLGTVDCPQQHQGQGRQRLFRSHRRALAHNRPKLVDLTGPLRGLSALHATACTKPPIKLVSGDASPARALRQSLIPIPERGARERYANSPSWNDGWLRIGLLQASMARLVAGSGWLKQPGIALSAECGQPVY